MQCPPTFPLLCRSQSLKNFFRCHVSFGKRQVWFNISQPEPHVSLHIVPGNSLPIQIEHSQLVSPLSRASQIRVVLGSFSVPFGCQRIVLGYALPILIHLSERNVCVGVALFC